MSSAHGASPNGDGTELESVRALRWVNTKEHARIIMGLTGGWDRRRWDRILRRKVSQWSQPMKGVVCSLVAPHASRSRGPPGRSHG